MSQSMRMTCDEVERSLPWFLDDELEGEVALEIEEHIGGCDSCRAALEREGELRLILRRASASISVPAVLRRSVREAIERERRTQQPFYRAWPAAAAAVIFIALIWRGASGSGGDFETVAERHARNLPMDVVAADIAQVQDYFNHKLPFRVRLPQLAGGAGSSLGGRVVHLRDRDAAYVRYNIPQGRVSVFVYEDPDEDLSSEVAPLYRLGNHRVIVREVHGYRVAKWRAAGLTYSLITDLPSQEFTQLLPAATR